MGQFTHHVKMIDCFTLSERDVLNLPIDMYFLVCYIGHIYGNKRTPNENITRTFPFIKR